MAQPASKLDTGNSEGLRSVIRDVISEFLRAEHAKSEPAYKVELLQERQKREQLERRLNELAEENRRSRTAAEEAERSAAVKSELQRLGVSKVDLAFRIVKDDIQRTPDGRLLAKGDEGDMSVREYLQHFVNANPEFLPARISGGSGVTSAPRATAPQAGTVELDKIRPGMSAEEMERVRQEISRIASQALKGL